jgi:hypothetical protein
MPVTTPLDMSDALEVMLWPQGRPSGRLGDKTFPASSGGGSYAPDPLADLPMLS